MRIIYIHQYFRTPEQGGALRSYYIATALAHAGHDVELITAHNEDSYVSKKCGQFTVHQLPVSYDNRFGSARRIYAFLRFAYLSIRRIQKLTAPDCFYITSTPLTTSLIGLFFRKRNIPFIFEVRDLWPEAPFQMGYFRDPLSRRLLLQLEHRAYSHADILVGLSPGIVSHIQSKVPEKKVHLVPNMADCNFFGPGPPEAAVQDNSSAAFSIAYTGAIGKVNGLEYLLDAAKACRDRDVPVLFHIVGTGATHPQLKRRAADMQLDNVRFYGHLSKTAVRDVLDRCEAVYISFRKLPVLTTNSPNKFFDGLAAAKVCIVNCQGWIQAEIEEYECGFYTDPSDPVQLVRHLECLIEHPEKISEMQQNARRLAIEKYSREKLTAEIVHIIENRSPGNALNKESAYTLTC